MSSEVEDSRSSELVALLRKKGLDAVFKKSYSTPAGRREPDITISLPEGVMLLEAKVPPAGLPKAMGQVAEYQQSVGAVERIKAVFAVVYANKLDKNFQVYFQTGGVADIQKLKSLDELSAYIADKASLKQSAPVQLSTQKLVGILSESASLITASLSKTSAEEIEGIFGNREFFSTVMDFEEEKQVADSVLKNAAAYLLLNQVFFYEILSRETDSYPRIDVKELKSGQDLMSKYFSRVLRVDYKPIFGFNVAAAITSHETLEAVKTVIAAIQLVSSQVIPHDLLGKIFHNLIPLSLRKTVAAYYTNSEAAELLAHLAVEDKKEGVFDPACGSGTLLVAAYNRKKGLYEKFSGEHHVRFLEHEIYGSDIMPFAAHLAAVNLALQAPLKFTNKVNILVTDSTALAPGEEVAPAQEVFKESYRTKLTDFHEGVLKKSNGVKNGAIDLLEQERDVRLPKFDVVLMNPPFTRFQRIPVEYKKKLAKRFSQKRYREIVHGQLGLHGYFLLLADKFLLPGGRLAAVLPLTTISLEGFYGIVRLLLDNYQIEHVIVSSGRAAFSENTSLREILLVARKEEPVPETRTKFTFIHSSPAELTLEKARGIAEKIKKFDEDEFEDGDVYVRQVNQKNLAQDIRALYQNVTLHSPQLVKINYAVRKWFKRSKNFAPLENIEKKEEWRIAENPRGLESKGYYALSLLAKRENGRALKDHDVWEIQEETHQLIKVRHRFNQQAFKIPRSCVVPQFRRFSGQQTVCLNEPGDYLVVRKFDDFDDFIAASALADEKMRNNVKTSLREGEWEKFVRKNSARLFGFYRGDITASGTSLMAVRSDEPAFAGSGGSWVFYAPQKHDKLTQLWLNSSIAFYHILRDRKETRGGFVELDKYVFLNMPYPLQEKTDSKKVDLLEKELSAVEFPSLLEQFQNNFAPRRRLDLFFLETAGAEKEEAEKFLDLLYETLAKELLRLKGVMGK